MSKVLTKEKILAKGVTAISTKSSSKNGKKRKSFNNHSTDEDYSNSPIAEKLGEIVFQLINDDIFVSPVVGTFSVRAKIKVGGKIEPLPVDNVDIVYLDE